MKNKPLTEIESAPPVYFMAKDGPPDLTVAEVSAAAEDIVGFDRIAGAVRKGALWRVHGKTDQDRVNLLAGNSSLTIKKKNAKNRLVTYTIQLTPSNPYANFDAEGNEIPSTKLLIDGFLLSVSNDDIKKKLEEIPGVTLRSHIFLDRAWLDNGQLSRWVNGRRYAFIDVPKDTLPKTMKVGAFEAFLYYRERPKEAQKCWDCKQEGHKRGDSDCPNPRAPGPQENVTRNSLVTKIVVIVPMGNMRVSQRKRVKL